MNNFHGFNQICSKHPHHMSVGVCGSCVRERLASLIDSIDSLPPPPPPDPPLVPNLPLAEEHEHEHEHDDDDDDDDEEEEDDDDDDDEKEVDPPPPHSGHGFHDMLASLPHLKLTPHAKKNPLNHHHGHNSVHHNVSNATLSSRDVAEKSQRKKTTGTGTASTMMMMMMMRAPSSRGSFASESELNIETSSSASHNTPHVGNHLTATPSHAHAHAHALVNHANKKSSNSWFSAFSHVPTKPKPLKKPIVHSDRDSEQLVKVMKSPPPPPPPPHQSWILYSTSNTKAQQQQPEQAKSGSKRVNHHHKADLEAISETNNLNISVANPITHHHNNNNNNSNINRSNSSSWLLSLFNRRKSSRSSSKRHTNGGGGGDVNVNINININKVRGEEIDRSDGSRVTPDHRHHHHELPSFLANMENVVIEGMMSPAPNNKWDELVQAKQGVGYIPNVAYNKVPKKMSDEHVNGMMEGRGSNMRLGGDASPARSEDICMSRNVTNDGHELLQGMPPHGLQRCKSVHVTRGSNTITFDLKQVASSPMNNNIVMQQPRDSKGPNVQQPHHLLHPHFNIPNDYEEYNASADAEIRNFPRSRSWGRRAWSRTLSPLWGLKNNNNRKVDVSIDNETPTATRNHRRHHHHHRGFHDHPHPGSLTPTHIFNSKSSSGATITTSTSTTTTTSSSSSTSIPSSTTSYLSPLRRNNLSHDTRIHSAQ